jgi:hemoglobin
MKYKNQKQEDDHEPIFYDTLGGQGAIDAVVDAFYQRILADERINKHFDNTDMDRQRKHQAAFISQALGGPQSYSGRSMSKAHAGLNLSKDDFGAVAGHLADTLASFNVPQEHINTIIGKVATLEPDIISK